MINSRRPFFVLTAGALILAACSGGALAQDSKPSQGQDALKGPKVKEGGVPGENRRFSGGEQKRKDQMGASLPHPMFVRAIDTLKGEKADPSVRLSDDQIKSLDKIDEAFKSEQKAYREAHREELMALRDQLPENARRRLDGVLGAGGPGDKPGKKGPPPAKGVDGDKPMDSDKAMDSDKSTKGDTDSAQAMARVKELLAGAPKVEDTHTKMWSVLNEAQKTKVQNAITRLKTDAEARKAKGEGKDGKPAELTNLPPKMQERLKNMTPEEREQAIKRYQERQKNENQKNENPKKQGDKKDGDKK